MKVVVFDQWERLAQLLQGIAASSAKDSAQYALNRVVVSASGRATLKDRAMNNLAVSGGTTILSMPEIEPGKARDFALRVKATGDNILAFEGAGAFEGEPGALAAPLDGETAVYLFTEVDGDVLLVSRRTVATITE